MTSIVKSMLLIAIRLIGKYVLELLSHSTGPVHHACRCMRMHRDCNMRKHPIRVSAMIAMLAKKGVMKKVPGLSSLPYGSSESVPMLPSH